jgi:hypothetical protein
MTAEHEATKGIIGVNNKAQVLSVNVDEWPSLHISWPSLITRTTCSSWRVGGTYPGPTLSNISNYSNWPVLWSCEDCCQLANGTHFLSVSGFHDPYFVFTSVSCALCKSSSRLG